MAAYNLNYTFTIGDRSFKSDAETLEVLRGIFPRCDAEGCHTAVLAVIILGIHAGRVVELNT
jgi:hypothetical protein